MMSVLYVSLSGPHPYLLEIEKEREAVAEWLAAGYDYGAPRFGMEYDPEGKYQRPSDKFETVQRIWNLRETGRSYSDIVDETGVPQATVYRVVQDRKWYEERA